MPPPSKSAEFPEIVLEVTVTSPSAKIPPPLVSLPVVELSLTMLFWIVRFPVVSERIAPPLNVFSSQQHCPQLSAHQ